ncbi:PREDICTED: translation initiation factor IF-2-like [Chinchilla lanigera]|uniref:translation initiation factor IF-2-like n=1 Tax=Chinchilla lanigera TaxID=34839 RepID=UPI000698A6B0|nr:PREDICTED: translation initiation factor IF-2-like [Chinchilla lanigera]
MCSPGALKVTGPKGQTLVPPRFTNEGLGEGWRSAQAGSGREGKGGGKEAAVQPAKVPRDCEGARLPALASRELGATVCRWARDRSGPACGRQGPGVPAARPAGAGCTVACGGHCLPDASPHSLRATENGGAGPLPASRRALQARPRATALCEHRAARVYLRDLRGDFKYFRFSCGAPEVSPAWASEVQRPWSPAGAAVDGRGRDPRLGEALRGASGARGAPHACPRAGDTRESQGGGALGGSHGGRSERGRWRGPVQPRGRPRAPRWCGGPGGAAVRSLIPGPCGHAAGWRPGPRQGTAAVALWLASGWRPTAVRGRGSEPRTLSCV